jgi:hypothetical protein
VTVVAILLSLAILALTPPKFRGGMAVIYTLLVILTFLVEFIHEKH